MSAQPIRCDTGNDENIAIMLVTNLVDGTVVGLCAHCVPDYLRGVAQAFDAALAPQPAAEQPADDADATGNGTRKRARPRKRAEQTPDVPTGADDQQAQPATQDASAD